MITKAYVGTMAAYNSEMNRRFFVAAGSLDAAERHADRGAFWGSIHGTFCHLLWADRMWMHRFDGWERPAGLLAESGRLIAEFDALSAARIDTDRRLERWAAALDDSWLEGRLDWFSGAAKRQMQADRTMVVMHMFNHQAHHRGQIHALLTRAGVDTGATDLLAVLKSSAVVRPGATGSPSEVSKAP